MEKDDKTQLTKRQILVKNVNHNASEPNQLGLIIFSINELFILSIKGQKILR